MNLVSIEDMNYYINQSEDNINKMLVGMSTIINGIDYQTEFLENQTWLQRIMKTITGQNKVTKEEIKKNYEKLTLYMVEIVQELYKKNVISYQFLFNLNSNLNKLYLEQNKLFENFIDFKEYFKKTIVKLNDKIESIDNFYMLNEEIKQGKYEGMYPIFILCDIISNLDERTIFDNRKMNILYKTMKQQNIINDENILINEFFKEVLNLPINIIEKIYIDLNGSNKTLLLKVLFEIIESYYFMNDTDRYLISKKLFIKKILEQNLIDSEAKISFEKVYCLFIENKKSLFNNFKIMKKEILEKEERLKREQFEKINQKLRKINERYNEMKSFKDRLQIVIEK